MLAGHFVNTKLEDLAMPERCPSCDGPPETRILIRHPLRTRTAVSVPQCLPCQQRLAKTKNRDFLTNVVVVVGAGALCGAGFLLVSERTAWLLFCVAVGGIAIILGMRALLADALFGRTAKGARYRGVEIAGASKGKVVLFCRNQAWAKDVAALSGATTRAGRRWLHPRPAAAVFGGTILVGGCLTVWTLLARYGRVAIDNPTHEPLRIFVDGAPRLVAEPNPGGSRLQQIWVAVGEHDIGYASRDATQSANTIRVRVAAGGNLYTPKGLGCYRLKTSVYGKMNPEDGEEVLLRGQEFHSLGTIDDWFQESPSELKTHELWTKRVALVRNEGCTTKTVRRCETAPPSTLTDCRSAALSGEGAETRP